MIFVGTGWFFVGRESASMIGVAIVSYNTCDILRNCLQSLRLVTIPLQVVVVDNASRDDSVAMMHREFPEVHVIARSDNLGFAKGTNMGMQYLLTQYPAMEYVLMLNPDTEVHAMAIEQLHAFLELHPRVGVVSPRLENPDGSLQRAAFRFPTPLMTLLDVFPPGQVMPGRFFDSWWHGRYPQEVSGVLPFAIDHPLGACMLTRRSVLESVGMLDEMYHMYVEEVDWCRQVRQAGWAIWQDPRAVVMHIGGASSQQFRAASFRAIWQSRALYWQRWASADEQRWHRLWLRLGVWRWRWLAWWSFRRGEVSAEQYAEQREVYRSITK
jgi:hypothetical protein